MVHLLNMVHISTYWIAQFRAPKHGYWIAQFMAPKHMAKLTNNTSVH